MYMFCFAEAQCRVSAAERCVGEGGTGIERVGVGVSTDARGCLRMMWISLLAVHAASYGRCCTLEAYKVGFVVQNSLATVCPLDASGKWRQRVTRGICVRVAVYRVPERDKRQHR